MEDGTMNHSLDLSNTSAVFLAIPFCYEDKQPVLWANYSLATFSFVAIAINILHVFILSKLESLKESPYYVILVHISIGDMLHGFGTGMRLSLCHPSYFIHANIIGFIAFNQFMDWMIIGRNMIMAAASLERYYAVCCPMEYDQKPYITKLNLWMSLIWVCSFMFNLLRDIVFHKSFCFHFSTGPTNSLGVGPGIINVLVTLVPFIITTVTLSRVCVELLRMRKRATSHGEEQVKSATHYLIIIIVAFYASFIPPTVEYALQISGQFSLARFYINMVLLMGLYGILNTVVYGWRTPAYQRCVAAALTRRDYYRESNPNTMATASTQA